jgi:hypothetical protein
VLAAALSADADILLTGNARHWMAARHIELLTSAQLLTRLADEFLDKNARRAPAGRAPAGQSIRNLAQILKAEQVGCHVPADRARPSRNSISVSAG